jgi:hypothetical protein
MFGARVAGGFQYKKRFSRDATDRLRRKLLGAIEVDYATTLPDVLVLGIVSRYMQDFSPREALVVSPFGRYSLSES